jgi:hypothetical protein
MMGLDHLYSKYNVFKRTSNGGFVTEAGFKSMSKLPVVAQGIRGGNEKERKINPCEKHVGSCHRRRKEGEERNERGRGDLKERLRCMPGSCWAMSGR